MLLVFCTVIFNYLFFIGYINSKKTDFRKELLQSNISIFEKKEILKADLYKNKNGIVWHENNKEISVNGCFYEVLRIEQKADVSVLYIINDKKENDLFTSYNSVNNTNKAPTLNFVKLFLSLHYLKTENLNLEVDPGKTEKIGICTVYQFHSDFTFKKVKPPRFIFA